jgi:hypothetical protein
VLALVLIAATRGKLAVDKFREVQPAAERAPDRLPGRLTPQRLVLYLVLAAAAAYVIVNLAYGLITGTGR